jgi:signal transduction histidine kinase
MHFTIQDLLDYAQIRADKFRKNISKFNVVDTVKKVIAIQQQQADQKSVNLHYELEENKQTNDNNLFLDDETAIISSDEQRII